MSGVIMTKSSNAGSALVELCWISSHFSRLAAGPKCPALGSDLYDVSGFVVPRSTEGNVVHAVLNEVGLRLTEERVNGGAEEEAS